MSDDVKDNWHDGLPVAGYQPQSDYNVTLVNCNKRAEEGILRMLDGLKADKNFDKRWLNIAKTHIEQGFMAMNRAIMQPQRLTLAGDTDATPTPPENT